MIEQKTTKYQVLVREFPKQGNREFASVEQGICAHVAGNLHLENGATLQIGFVLKKRRSATSAYERHRTHNFCFREVLALAEEHQVKGQDINITVEFVGPNGEILSDEGLKRQREDALKRGDLKFT